jgi:hypothetical protein
MPVRAPPRLWRNLEPVFFVDTIGFYPPPVYTSSICLLAMLTMFALSNS